MTRGPSASPPARPSTDSRSGPRMARISSLLPWVPTAGSSGSWTRTGRTRYASPRRSLPRAPAPGPRTVAASLSRRAGGAAGTSAFVGIDGTGLMRLTGDSTDDLNPTWSPDGRHIAFTSVRDGNADIWVLDLVTHTQVRLTNHPAADDAPAWSPDGQLLAFTSTRSGNRDIYLMRADGRGLRRLTAGSAVDGRPTWSPDGRQLAVQAVRGDNYDVDVIDVLSGERRQVAASPTYDGEFAWSPDGTRLAFVSSRDGLDAVYVTTLSGTTVTRLTSAPSLDPGWSP